MGVDHGQWYEIKIEELKCIDPLKASTASIHQGSDWNTFPSVLLLKFFNEGHIHHHIAESVQFIGKKESMTDDDNDINNIHTEKPL